MESETIPETVTETVPPTDADKPTDLLDIDVSALLEEDAPAEDDAPAVDEVVEPDGDETAAEEGGHAPADAVEEVVAPAAPAQPAAPDPAIAEQQKQQTEFAQRVTAYNAALAAHKQKMATPGHDFDPFTDGAEAARLQVEAAELLSARLAIVEGVAQQQTAVSHAEQVWTDWGKKNPDIGTKLARDIYGEEYEKAAKKYPSASAETLQTLATDRWESRIELRRAQARAKNPTPVKGATANTPAMKAKVTAGGGRITPAAGTTRAATAPRTAEDDLVATISGKVRSFID